MGSFGFFVLLTGALAGGFVSGLAGFGTGLVALGIWLYAFPPAIAVPLVACGSEGPAKAIACRCCDLQIAQSAGVPTDSVSEISRPLLIFLI